MGKLNDLLRLVEDSEIFKGWKNKNNDSYLCAFFKYVGSTENPEWQVHFYQPKSDTITVFKIGAEIQIIEENSAILKKDDTVQELNLDKAHVDFVDALNISDEFRKDTYPNEIVIKRIVILQKLKDIKCAIWNITCMTTSFNLLNTKIDAESGQIIDESLKPLLKYGKEK